MRSDARVLTQDEEHTAIDMALRGGGIAKISEILGFADPTRFWEYRKRNPDFSKSLDAAREQACEMLEDRILTVVDDSPSPHAARVMLDALVRALSYRKPERYGQRVELNVNANVDIAHSLGRMQQALDATYQVEAPALGIQNPSEIKRLW